ncbi:MAG: molybdopterin-guanine dinucleotide biosynthesis protein [Streptosporangiales bacterium]|nr:molybdopterin-guanine dinucleotide biosynthesis protein [Streptosporangiales bacterium]
MTLIEWAGLCADELGLDLATEKTDVDRVLDLARDAAHQVARPAAPLTTYLLGIAVGRGADPADAAARLTALANSRPTDQNSGGS